MVLYEKVAATNFGGTLSFILPPEAKPLTQWSPGFTDVLLNTWARFTHGSDKLNIGLLWLFSLKVSHAESKMDVVIPLSWTELWPILHFKNLVTFCLLWSYFQWSSYLVCHLKNYKLAD